MASVPRRVAPHINPYSRPHPMESESIVERVYDAIRPYLHDDIGAREATKAARAAISAMRTPDMNAVLAVSRKYSLQPSIVDLIWTELHDDALK